MFDVRKDRGIIFVQWQKPGQTLKSEIKAGDEVTLHIGSECVLVRTIERVGSNRWKGIAYGFEPSFTTEFKGIKLDDIVEFGEENIFGCSGA